MRSLRHFFFGRFPVLAALSCLVLLALLAESASAAAVAPPFGDMRGVYKGVATVVVTNNKKRRTISGPVKITVRLSRSKKVLQIRVEGTALSNAKKGRLDSYYQLAGKGGARVTFKESITPGSIKGKGTTNLRRRSGKFTLSSRGYGSRGITKGTLKLNGTTLKIQQTYKGGANDVVQITYLAPKRGSK